MKLEIRIGDQSGASPGKTNNIGFLLPFINHEGVLAQSRKIIHLKYNRVDVPTLVGGVPAGVKSNP